MSHMEHEFEWKLVATILRRQLEESEKRNQQLTEALQHYESPDNWECDDVGIARVWLEPDSFSRRAYAGFELAMKALDGLKKETI